MQAVSVYPHHHHAHTLCLGQEMESTRPVKSTHACTSECITHFQLTIPSSGSCFSHKKAVSRPPFILWAACDLSAIHTLQISRRPYTAYQPDLYLSRPIGGKGMLLWQGVAAYKLYTGLDMPVEEYKKFQAENAK